MKNKPRIHNNNNPDTSKPQPKKPSIPGQDATTIGHLEKSQLCKLLNFTPQQMEAFAEVAEWQGESLASYLRTGALGILKASMEDLEIASRENLSRGDRAAKTLLGSAAPLFTDCGITIGSGAMATALQSENNNTPVLPVPQTLADDARAALLELDSAAAAAATLLMMVADNFCENMGGYAPCDKTGAWEQFAKSEVLTAPLDLAIKQITRFRPQLDLWRKEQLSIIEGKPRNFGERLEVEILELNALLLLQASAFDRQYRVGDGISPILVAQSVTERLWSAYMKSIGFRSALRKTEPSKQAA